MKPNHIGEATIMRANIKAWRSTERPRRTRGMFTSCLMVGMVVLGAALGVLAVALLLVLATRSVAVAQAPLERCTGTPFAVVDTPSGRCLGTQFATAGDSTFYEVVRVGGSRGRY